MIIYTAKKMGHMAMERARPRAQQHESGDRTWTIGLTHGLPSMLRPRTGALRAVLLAAVFLLTGCLARPHLDQQSFIFAPPPPSSPMKAVPGARVLGLRTLQVAAPFEGRAFVCRTGEFSYESDPYAEFKIPPAEAMVPPITGWLREAGLFSAVTESGSALKPDTLVEIHVGQLYGDFRPSEQAKAVLSMRFVFFDAPRGNPAKVLLQQEYTRSIPLKARTASALIEGWNQALAQILEAAMPDFRRIGPAS